MCKYKTFFILTQSGLGWQGGFYWGCLMASSGAFRSIKDSWKWSRRQQQRSVAAKQTAPLDISCIFSALLWSFLKFWPILIVFFFFFSAKCTHDLPPCSQIPHWLSAHHSNSVLSQHQSSTHCCWKQPEHPRPQVRRHQAFQEVSSTRYFR